MCATNIFFNCFPIPGNVTWHSSLIKRFVTEQKLPQLSSSFWISSRQEAVQRLTLDINTTSPFIGSSTLILHCSFFTLLTMITLVMAFEPIESEDILENIMEYKLPQFPSSFEHLQEAVQRLTVDIDTIKVRSSKLILYCSFLTLLMKDCFHDNIRTDGIRKYFGPLLKLVRVVLFYLNFYFK